MYYSQTSTFLYQILYFLELFLKVILSFMYYFKKMDPLISNVNITGTYLLKG